MILDTLKAEDDHTDVSQYDIQLDFPLIAPDQRLKAKVVLWKPPSSTISTAWKGDIAGLEIVGSLPRGVKAVDIVKDDNLWKREFRAFGFPQGFNNGLWASGRILAEEGNSWLQIEGQDTSLFVRPGFSGTPLWDEKLGGIVGMVVASEGREEKRIAFAISANELVNAWDETIKQQLNTSGSDENLLERIP